MAVRTFIFQRIATTVHYQLLVKFASVGGISRRNILQIMNTLLEMLVMWKLPDWGTASGWNAPTTYYIIIMDYASVITLDEQHACNECSNTQTHRIQKYVNWTTSDFTVRPQILLSDLRIYSTTSEFTVRPQNLQYDLRIYSTTSEFTVRPQNLQYDLRVLLSDLGFWKFKF